MKKMEDLSQDLFFIFLVFVEVFPQINNNDSIQKIYDQKVGMFNSFPFWGNIFY